MVYSGLLIDKCGKFHWAKGGSTHRKQMLASAASEVRHVLEIELAVGAQTAPRPGRKRTDAVL